MISFRPRGRSQKMQVEYTPAYLIPYCFNLS